MQILSKVAPGERLNTSFKVSEGYSGRSVFVPVHVRRGSKDGPTVFVTAALHGDELNGTGAIREVLADDTWELKSGAVVMVPVLNMLGFERFSRYLPDRRDLNRFFPGASNGSMAAQMAHRIFEGIIRHCDYGIDLHTAAVRRTNYPNVRADLDNSACETIAKIFGAGIVLGGAGPEGSLRRAATDAGVPTVVVEGGEVWKMEPSVVSCMSRGVMNVLKHLDMVDGEPEIPSKQTVINRTKWLRAQRGGLIQLHVAPGDSVEKGQTIATNCDLLNSHQHTITTPLAGVVIGCSTLPAVRPGEPILHIGQLDTEKKARLYEQRVRDDELQRTAREHLSTNVIVTSPEDSTEVPGLDDANRTDDNRADEDSADEDSADQTNES